MVFMGRGFTSGRGRGFTSGRGHGFTSGRERGFTSGRARVGSAFGAAVCQREVMKPFLPSVSKKILLFLLRQEV